MLWTLTVNTWRWTVQDSLTMGHYLWLRHSMTGI